MVNNTGIFKNKTAEFYRFNQEEIETQKRQLAAYILIYLTESTEESLTNSIQEIEAITGVKLDMQKAALIRQEGLKKLAEQEQKKSIGLR